MTSRRCPICGQAHRAQQPGYDHCDRCHLWRPRASLTVSGCTHCATPAMQREIDQAHHRAWVRKQRRGA